MGVSKRIMTAIWALMFVAVLALSMTVSPATALAKSDKNTASGGTPVSYMVTGVTTPTPAPAPLPSTPASSAVPLPVLNDAAHTSLWIVVAIVSGVLALFAYATIRRMRRRL